MIALNTYVADRSGKLVSIHWRRENHCRRRYNTTTRWWLGNTGWCVRHCGHPTANWPWHGVTADGVLILDVNGRAFGSADEAKEATCVLFLSTIGRQGG